MNMFTVYMNRLRYDIETSSDTEYTVAGKPMQKK